MTEDVAATPTPLRSGLELLSVALEVLGAGVILYRLAAPNGPEPLDLLRDAWGDAKAWVRSRRQYRSAMLETLERIRDLPETDNEGEK